MSISSSLYRSFVFSLRKFYLAVIATTGFLMFFGATVQGQVNPSYYSYPYNHLDWYTIESKQFLIHFQEGNSRSAKVVSRVAEEVYPYITGLYDHEPENKVSIILKDREDYSNGAAYFYDDMIDIWVPPLDTKLRGTHNWYRNVISHEFTHIVQLQAAMKRDRQIPAIYFQWLSYEEVRRPDVLYGFPKGIATFPFAGISVPAWFAEGTAQYQRSGLYYETWDSHRDMLLRNAILNDTYLGFDEMAHFSSKTSIQRELVYNQGYAFTIYLVMEYGEEILPKLTRKLSESGLYEADQAIKEVTGTSGQKLFKQWIEERKKFYKEATASIEPTPSELVEDKGYYNYHPTYNSKGDTLAYLSNRGFFNSRIFLYMKPDTVLKKSASASVHGEAEQIVEIAQLGQPGSHRQQPHSYQQKPAIKRVGTPFSFAPDGKRMVYSRITKNKYGEEYRDLHIYDLHKKKTTKKLTTNGRLRDPAWSPVGEHIAAARQDGNTMNLVRYDLERDSVIQLTGYKNSEQVYEPAWGKDSRYIYYSHAQKRQRSIYRYDTRSGEVTPWLADEYTDYRNPHVSPDGHFLYFSADRDGIFNIYRIPITDRLPSMSEMQQLTSVMGGAFMPEVTKQGTLYYSLYRKGGYKIARSSIRSLQGQTNHGRYQPPMPQNDTEYQVQQGIKTLNNFDDSDLEHFDAPLTSLADTGRYAFTIPTHSSSDKRLLYRYDDTITDFSFFPIVRFDNYSMPEGQNGKLLTAGRFGDLGRNLIRDFKLGTYFSSRDVTQRLSVFGGAMFGVGSQDTEGLNDFFNPSRLVSLDRDLFLNVEYQGLPFIKRYWSPTISFEIYNMKRNVDDGLSIEEFPCTSCMPDTSYTNTTYDIWEANLYLRSKLNRFSLLELGIIYSPYRVSTDDFYSKELEQTISGTSSQYYKGTRLTAAYIFDMDIPYRHGDIAPVGLTGTLRYNYEPSELLESYEVEGGTLSPVYETTKNHSFELKGRYGFPLTQRTTGSIRVRGFSYLQNPDDFFYLDYAGGFSGMRSYPYFAIGGNTTAFSTFSWYVPLITGINEQMGRFSIDKSYLRLFAEAGNGWRGPYDVGNQLKTGIGAELRWSLNGYYLFPLKWFVSASYGFNQFNSNLPEDFITPGTSNEVSYGQEMLFHFGFSFDFEILQ